MKHEYACCDLMNDAAGEGGVWLFKVNRIYVTVQKYVYTNMYL